MNKNQRTTLHTLSVLALAALMGACTSAPSQPAAPMPPTIAQHSTPDLASYDWNLTAAFDAQGQPDGRWLLAGREPLQLHFEDQRLSVRKLCNMLGA
ncbi:MAG: heat-shock protein, partial [Alicycliphilus sp.]|nr:heat-shock protein [Alicycliphilus sp.]